MRGVVNPVTGYRHITITANRSDTGKQKRAHIHHLVCEAFHGPRPEGLLALHRNGDKLDNRAENLYWGTSRQNMEDSIRHGTAAIQPGEGNVNSIANRARRSSLGLA